MSVYDCREKQNFPMRALAAASTPSPDAVLSTLPKTGYVRHAHRIQKQANYREAIDIYLGLEVKT